MDSRIKIPGIQEFLIEEEKVSILVLMDSRIKIVELFRDEKEELSFNPCFNG